LNRTTNWIIGSVLGILVTSLLIATAPHMGVTWDEPAYIAAAESYIAWFDRLFDDPARALRDRTITRYWQINHEHPPLNKVWGGLFWRLTRPLLDQLTAHRVGNMILVGLLVVLLYVLVADQVSPIAGGAAVAALITMPRFFFHAHLAALDVPAAVTVFGTTFIFWRTRDDPAFQTDVFLGIAWGVAIATKINALFVPPIFLLWALIFGRRRYLFRRLVVMGALGLVLFLAVWPWLYHQFWPRLIEYVLFVTVDHWQIAQFYLGQTYLPPPWHFPFVMILVVVPLTTTLLYLLGLGCTMAARTQRPFGALLMLSAVLPLVALATGQSVVYDNERLFMPAFPFLAALAGIGFDAVLAFLWRRFRPPAKIGPALAIAAAAVLLFIPPVVRAGDLYPHLLSYYSAGIGGLGGAVRLGLETTYWCETYNEALSYLNTHAAPQSAIWVELWSHDVLFYYQILGRLDPDLRIRWPSRGSSVFDHPGLTGHQNRIDQADFVVIQYRQTGFDDRIRAFLREREPVYRLDHRGIPLLEIYVR
jgi:4-amino-4-deoxy-L-arabinose transferase-like glycosyltransferase